MRLRFILMSIVLGIFICVVPMTIVHADSTDSLPKGFVAPEDMFGYDEERETNIDTVNQLLNYGLIDGVYLVFDYVKDNDGYIYGKKQEPDSEYDEISQTMTNTPSPFAITLKQKHAGGITASGTYYKKHTFPEGSMMAGDTREYKNEMTITISNVTFKQNPDITWESYDIYADVKGRLSTTKAYNGTWDEKSKVYDLITPNDGRCYSSYYDYKDDNGNKIFYAAFITRTKEVNNSYLTIYFRIAGVLPKGAKTGAISNALVTTGEDGGVSIPVAIVLGIVAAGAAIAGVAGAGGNNSDVADEDKKKKSYKMYVQKDFGDSIKKGAKEPSIIRARMAEIDELGKEHERNDLTAKISVSGENMVIQNVALAGKYIEAKVSVPKDTTGDRAKITFTFTGEGGTFDNTVIFKLVDGPHIEFISAGEEEGTHNENCGINAILGDSFTYEARFMTVDVTTPPTINDIKAKNPSEFDVKFEETSEHLVYKMILKNNTKALDKKDVFAKVKEERFEISVNVKDEEKPLQGFVAVMLYPEGITVDSTERGKKNDVEYIGIQSYEKEEVGELDSNWQPTTIKFTLAIIGEDKIIIDPKGAKYQFEKIKGAGGLGSKADIENAIAEKYKYKESTDNNYEKFQYVFEPNTMLWDPEDGTFFMTLLPVTAEYQEYSYKEEIPLRICGKKVDEVEEWNREYEKVRNRIERFSVPGEKDRNLKKLKEFAIADQYKASVLELRLMSKDILRSYMKYWTNEHEKDEYDMKVLEWQVFGLECAKWIGDCAFSFLVSAYAGPLADAIISPAKDFATGAIGELYAAWKYGEKIDINIIERFEFTKSLASAGDNIVGNAIDITSWKKAAATLGGYFVYASIKAYIEKLNEGESDLYGAFVKGFSDMTLQAFKAAFSNLFKKWIETSKYFQDTIGPKIQKYVTDTTIENFQLKYNYSQQLYGELALKGAKEVEIKVTEALNSVISNLVGTGAGYIVDKTLENVHTSSGFSVKNNHLIFTFTMQAFQTRTYEVTLDINSILMNVSCPLFGWLYDMIFGSVPVSAKTIDVPKDPPLPNKN